MAPPSDGRGDTLVPRLRTFGSRPAVVDRERALTYDELLDAAEALGAELLDGTGSLAGERVAILLEPSVDHVVALLATWLVGAVAVPIKVGVPAPEIEYVLDDARPARLVTAGASVPALAPLAEPRGLPLVPVDGAGPPPARPPLPPVAADQGALVLYTSGTTGRPKGVLHTHASLAAQMAALTEAWGWTGDDRILLVLPLHHVHGLVNVVGCALWSGATCRLHPGFGAEAVWEALADDGLTLFMAVPTIYGRLIEAWEAAEEPTRRRWSAGARALRLMVSGSAALPVSTLERWEEVAGHVLLERYGMTEIGMALSNTLDDRTPGRVGWPLPGVEVRVVDDDGVDVGAGRSGELLVRGDAVFAAYWDRPEATATAFRDGWFRTGDVVVADERGSVRILGRASVDIIKSGGEKISALEIEEVFRTHGAVADCAVVGVDDPRWGERVCLAWVADGDPVPAPDLRAWGKTQLADHKVPRSFARVPELPRNAMGKVVKPDVARLFGDG